MHEKKSCKGTRKKYFRTKKKKKSQAVACYRILTVQEIIARIKNEIKSFYTDRETVTRMRRQIRESGRKSLQTIHPMAGMHTKVPGKNLT